MIVRRGGLERGRELRVLRRSNVQCTIPSVTYKSQRMTVFASARPSPPCHSECSEESLSVEIGHSSVGEPACDSTGTTEDRKIPGRLWANETGRAGSGPGKRTFTA